MPRKEVEDTLNVVTAKFSIKTQPVDVLFGFGVAHSIVYAQLVETLRLVPVCTKMCDVPKNQFKLII